MFIESCYVLNGKMRKYLPPSIPIFCTSYAFLNGRKFGTEFILYIATTFFLTLGVLHNY